MNPTLAGCYRPTTDIQPRFSAGNILTYSGQSILGDQGIVIEFLKKNVAKEKPVMEVGHGFIVLGKLQEMSGNKKTLPDLLPEQATIRTRGRYEISIKLTT